MEDAEKLLDRYRDANDPLKILIVTSKLLTGFDAPILQAMYLDKPLRDHTLLQAICRTNRIYGDKKTHGLIVDYLGVFDDMAKALEFDEKGVQKAVSNIAELIRALPEAMQKCLVYFAGVDRTLQGYEGLIAAQECLPTNELRDAFAAQFQRPHAPELGGGVARPGAHAVRRRTTAGWSRSTSRLKPSTGTGRLLWHALGAKTIELIHENVHVEAVRDDLDTLVLDVDLLEAVLGNPRPVEEGQGDLHQADRAGSGSTRRNPKYKALAGAT